MSCLHVRPVTSVSFDIGISNLADWSITMRGCVKFIHDPETTLNFDLKVKFIGFDMFSCLAHNFFWVWHWPTIFGTWVYHQEEDMTFFRPHLFLSFGLVILCSACGCITMVRCVTYSHELCMTLTFDLYVGGGGYP